VAHLVFQYAFLCVWNERGKEICQFHGLLRSISFIVFSELKLILWLTFPHCFACKVPQKRGIYHLVINFDSSRYGSIARGKEIRLNISGIQLDKKERWRNLYTAWNEFPFQFPWVPALKNLIEYKLFYRGCVNEVDYRGTWKSIRRP
jgi:hypothetical protein